MTKRVWFSACAVVLWSVSAPGRASADPPSPDGSVTVSSEVEGETQVVSLAPAGRYVAKGDLLAELDDSRIQFRLDLQDLETRRLDAALISARLTREAAELAVGETEAELNEGRAELRHGIAMATTRLEGARAAVETALRRGDRADEVASARARVEATEALVKQAQSRLDLFEKQTVTQRLTAPRQAVETAKATERVTAEQRALAQTRLEELRRQVQACRVVAPIAGTLHYVRPPGTTDEGEYVVLAKGVKVRPRQTLFRIVPGPAPAPSPSPSPPPPLD